MRTAWLRGLQFEIVANLFVVMLAGLAIVAVIMGALAARTVERSAIDQLHSEARQLESSRRIGTLGLADLAALARTLPSGASGARWSVRDLGGRELGAGGAARPEDELAPLLAAARASGEPVLGGSVFSSDLTLVVPLQGREPGLLVGRVPRAALLRLLAPLLRSGAWVLVTAAIVFVVFGAYLLRWRIVAPIQALRAATARLAAGDLGVRIDAPGSDELAELAAGFNRMAESLARERQALLQTQQSLARSGRLAGVGQLAAGLAHEVGNPLAAIMGYAELSLRDTGLSPRSREAAERVLAEALRIRALVRELLELAAPKPLLRSSCTVRELLERVAGRMRPQRLLEGVTLELELEEGLPAILTDMARVEQILTNLVENAVHALVGQPTRTVILRGALSWAPGPARRRHDDPAAPDRERGGVEALSLSVIDDGPGVCLEDQSRVFDPFFTTKDPGEGTGLGLWNAHRLAELLGGRLELESAPGRTCFSLLLPLTDTALEPGEDDGPTACPDH